MPIRPRIPVALALSALLLSGIGAGVALARTRASDASTSDRSPAALPVAAAVVPGRGAFLDDVAKRLGISRSRLDAGLQAVLLDDVQFAQDNGFITKTVADELRRRIRSGDAAGQGRFVGPLGPPAFGPGGLISHHGLGGDQGSGLLGAAGAYLGISENDLADALATKTLAQLAEANGKSVKGLEDALHAAKKSELEAAITASRITQGQADALLARFDTRVGDLVNGIPPAITALAKHLGVSRDTLIAAIKGAAIDQVDAAVAADRITKTEGDLLKQRIRTSPALPLGGLGFCGGLGHGSLGAGPGFLHSPGAFDVESGLEL